jgi:RNA polymerase sigma-70 factor (ECF subfamily)
MQASDLHQPDLSVAGEVFRSRLDARLHELAAELGAPEVVDLRAVAVDTRRSVEAVRDTVSTRLMESFRTAHGRGAFGLLYELNAQHLLVQVAGRLRRYGSKADPRDVLQEVFFNVYRYPHRFNAEREDAFRVWSAMIVRNTVLKHLRALGRAGRSEVAMEDLSEQPETVSASPLSGAIEQESKAECARVYMNYLHLYLRFYGMLSERERTALQMVEVEELSYRRAAEALGIKLENLKMVIFRARRKIHRAMRRVFDGMSPDCRPAREPRATRDPVEGASDLFADDPEVEA